MRKGQHEPGKRRSIWTVLIPGQTGPRDQSGLIAPRGHQTNIPAQAYNFRDRRRARAFAKQIKGAKVSRSRKPFWTPTRILTAIIIISAVICLLGRR